MVLFYSRELNSGVTMEGFLRPLIAPVRIRLNTMPKIYWPVTEFREGDKSFVPILYVTRGVEADDVELFLGGAPALLQVTRGI